MVISIVFLSILILRCMTKCFHNHNISDITLFIFSSPKFFSHALWICLDVANRSPCFPHFQFPFSSPVSPRFFINVFLLRFIFRCLPIVIFGRWGEEGLKRNGGVALLLKILWVNKIQQLLNMQPWRQCVQLSPAPRAHPSFWSIRQIWPHSYPFVCSCGQGDVSLLLLYIPHHGWAASYFCRSLYSWCVQWYIHAMICKGPGRPTQHTPAPSLLSNSTKKCSVPSIAFIDNLVDPITVRGYNAFLSPSIYIWLILIQFTDTQHLSRTVILPSSRILITPSPASASTTAVAPFRHRQA